MAKSSTFYPAPNFAAPVISVRLYGAVEFGADWRALKEEIAERLECDADDLHIIDAAWADGERFADFVTLRGQIIGLLDDKLTVSEWNDLFATRVADGETLIAQVRASARARASVSIN